METETTLYSPKFKFFLNHQVMAILTNGGHMLKLSSRLDGRLFFASDKLNKWTDEEIREKCYEIHKSLKYDPKLA